VAHLQKSYATADQGDSQHKRWAGKVNVHHRQWWHHPAPYATEPAAVCKLHGTAANRVELLPQLLLPAAAAQPTTARQDSSAQQHPAMLLPAIQQLKSWPDVTADTYRPYGSLNARREAATVQSAVSAAAISQNWPRVFLHLSRC
jgi:hypothetical protein